MSRHNKPHYRHGRQSGNIFIALFAAVALLGTLGFVYNNLMRGPVQGVTQVTAQTRTETDLFSAANILIAKAMEAGNGGDCDGDQYIEPLPWRAPGGAAAPAGGGLIPSGTAARTRDGWGSTIGYCAWDHGPITTIDNISACGGSTANRLRGGDVKTEYVIALISAGPDRVFDTSCVAFNPANPSTPLVQRPAGSNDIVLAFTYAEAMQAGGLGGNLEDLADESCTPDAVGILRYSDGTVQVCTEDGWKEVGSEIESSSNFIPVTNAVLNSTHTSNAVKFSGFFGTRSASVEGGAVMFVNGDEVGTEAEISADDEIVLKATAAANPEEMRTFTFRLSAITRAWTITTRDRTPPNLVITPSPVNTMHVTNSANTETAYGSIVSFTVRNTGERETAFLEPADLNNTTNFEFYVGGGHYGDYCVGRSLSQNQTCNITIRPRATGDGPYSAVLRVTDNEVTQTVNLQGTASGWSCASPWGGPAIADGASITAYNASSVPCDNLCPAPVTRTCTNGVLSNLGSYQYQNCTTTACQGCPVGGVTVAHNETRTFYSAAHHTACSTIRQDRTCTDGVISGSGTFTHPSCSPPPCGGTSHAGYCWYLGSAGQNCDQICNNRGGHNINGTRNYAGSHGTSANCVAVGKAFGVTYPLAEPTGTNIAVGCSLWYGLSVSTNGRLILASTSPMYLAQAFGLLRYTTTTTANASHPELRRFCSCNN